MGGSCDLLQLRMLTASPGCYLRFWLTIYVRGSHNPFLGLINLLEWLKELRGTCSYVITNLLQRILMAVNQQPNEEIRWLMSWTKQLLSLWSLRLGMVVEVFWFPIVKAFWEKEKGTQELSSWVFMENLLCSHWPFPIELIFSPSPLGGGTESSKSVTSNHMIGSLATLPTFGWGP